jgi:hypothetical protein
MNPLINRPKCNQGVHEEKLGGESAEQGSSNG